MPVPERGIEEKVARLEELRRQVEATAKELLEAVDREKRESDERA
jgi:type II secretory pathway component PulJ